MRTTKTNTTRFRREIERTKKMIRELTVEHIREIHHLREYIRVMERTIKFHEERER